MNRAMGTHNNEVYINRDQGVEMEVSYALKKASKRFLTQEDMQQLLSTESFSDAIAILKAGLSKDSTTLAQKYWDAHPEYEYRRARDIGYGIHCTYSEFAAPLAAHLMAYLLHLKLHDQATTFKSGTLVPGLGLLLCELNLIEGVPKERAQEFYQIAEKLQTSHKPDGTNHPTTNDVLKALQAKDS